MSISFVDLCCLVRQTQFFTILTLTTSSPSVMVFYRMKQIFRCTSSKILDLRYCTCIFNILFSLSQYEIMSVNWHCTWPSARRFALIPFIRSNNNKKTIDNLNIYYILHYRTLYYIIFIFIEKNAYLGTLNIISWSLCYPRLRDGFNILCKNIENELRVYLSRRVAF